MRAVLFVCVCACYAAVGQDIREMPKYDSRYDYLDVDTILDSKRLVKNYVECLVTSQRCSPEGKQLKRILPEALRTKCVRCTDRQKKTAVKVIRRIKTDYPAEWAKLSAKWDPTGDFTRYFETVLAKDSSFTGDIDTSSETPPTPAPPPPPPPSPAPLPLTPPPPPPPSDTPSADTPATAAPDGTTPPRPFVLNRFGEQDDLVTGSPSQPPTPRPMDSTRRPTTPTYMRPATNRPTPMNWDGAASDAMPTRFPLRPVYMSPAYTTAITIIDQIGYKIMRTTELVTDILRNTVRAVVGR